MAQFSTRTLDFLTPVRVGSIEFEYTMPSVDVDKSNNTVEHDVLTEETVVQKINEKPREITISGMCTTEEAKDIDTELYDGDSVVTVRSTRASGTFLILNSSTSPRRAIRHDEWLHDFDIFAKEV